MKNVKSVMPTVYYCYLTNQLCIHTIKPSCCLTIFQTIKLSTGITLVKQYWLLKLAKK